MTKRKRCEQVWPSLEEGRHIVRMGLRRREAPLEPTEPTGAYAAYLAWLEVEARAAAQLGVHAA